MYPDVRVIHTHRNLVDAIGSQCNLSARIAAKFQRSLDYSRRGIERGLEARSEFPPSQIYDVRLKDLRATPFAVIEDIYNRFDVPFDGKLADP